MPSNKNNNIPGTSSFVVDTISEEKKGDGLMTHWKINKKQPVQFTIVDPNSFKNLYKNSKPKNSSNTSTPTEAQQSNSNSNNSSSVNNTPPPNFNPNRRRESFSAIPPQPKRKRSIHEMNSPNEVIPVEDSPTSPLHQQQHQQQQQHLQQQLQLNQQPQSISFHQYHYPQRVIRTAQRKKSWTPAVNHHQHHYHQFATPIPPQSFAQAAPSSVAEGSTFHQQQSSQSAQQQQLVYHQDVYARRFSEPVTFSPEFRAAFTPPHPPSAYNYSTAPLESFRFGQQSAAAPPPQPPSAIPAQKVNQLSTERRNSIDELAYSFNKVVRRPSAAARRLSRPALGPTPTSNNSREEESEVELSASQQAEEQERKRRKSVPFHPPEDVQMPHLHPQAPPPPPQTQESAFVFPASSFTFGRRPSVCDVASVLPPISSLHEQQNPQPLQNVSSPESNGEIMNLNAFSFPPQIVDAKNPQLYDDDPTEGEENTTTPSAEEQSNKASSPVHADHSSLIRRYSLEQENVSPNLVLPPIQLSTMQNTTPDSSTRRTSLGSNLMN